jgi:D-glycero-D-manno-heptose 1,7-bisphosphate phosphatase
MKPPAVFLDRDGTIIENRAYIADPEQVRLLPGAGEAIRRLSRAGYLVVVTSNQSGVARGLLDEEGLTRVHARMEELLAADGAKLDGAYYCPYLDGPEAVVEAYRADSPMRKPHPGMILQAAEELGIDLARSWMIGDSPADVEAGDRAGCHTILLSDDPSRVETSTDRPTHIAKTLLDAAVHVMERSAVHGGRQGDESHAPNRSSYEPRIVALLTEIRAELERAQRSGRQQDFSLLRLLGALLQMTAIFAALAGLVALFGERPESAAPCLLLACFFQLATLTAMLADRFGDH